MFEPRALEQLVGRRVQLMLVREGEARTAVIQGYDEFGIVAEIEGDPAPRSYFPWSAVSEIKLLPEH